VHYFFIFNINFRLMKLFFPLILFLCGILSSVKAQDTTARHYLRKEKEFHLINIDSVKKYGNLAIAEAEKNNEPKIKIEALLELAFNFRENAQYDEALSIALESKSLALKLSDSVLIANGCYLMASIYFEKDNLREAEKNYLSAIRLFGKNRMYDYQAYAQNGLANVYSYFKMNREAGDYYTQALETAKLSTNKRLPGTINNNLGNFYIKLKNFEKAEEYLKKAAEIFSSIGSYHDLSSVYFNSGFINIAKKNYDFAIAEFKKCIELGREYHLYEDQKDAYKELESVYKLQGNFEKAYAYADSFRILTDKLHADDLEKKIGELEIKFKLEEKNTELKAKEQEIKSDEEKIKAENIAISMLIGFMLLLVVFSIILLYFFKKNKAKNKYLEEQHEEIMKSKEKINKALAEKEMLLKEVHHRVKNNLQIISSLLNLQASSSNNQEVITELNYAKDRIHAISLVHKKLYATDAIGQIDANDYITELVEQQKRALFNDKTLTYTINTNSCSFSLNTSVPLGIIVNELITNCFKYAFVNTNSCELTIEISHLDQNTYKLKISDNGIGFPANFDIKNLSSLGMEIVFSLTEQLSGKANLYNKNGACIEIVFKENN
jgi:two-component sensor histidine kinase/Tfp pilus assembly protein PilF